MALRGRRGSPGSLPQGEHIECWDRAKGPLYPLQTTAVRAAAAAPPPFMGSPALRAAHGRLHRLGLCSPQPPSPVHTGSLSLKHVYSFIWEGRSRLPLQPTASEGQLVQQHQAQDLIWPGQEREAGQEAQGQSCSPWAKTQPPRLQAPDHLSSQFR